MPWLLDYLSSYLFYLINSLSAIKFVAWCISKHVLIVKDICSTQDHNIHVIHKLQYKDVTMLLAWVRILMRAELYLLSSLKAALKPSSWFPPPLTCPQKILDHSALTLPWCATQKQFIKKKIVIIAIFLQITKSAETKNVYFIFDDANLF